MKTFTTFLFSIVMLFGFSVGVMGQTLYTEDFTGQDNKGATGGSSVTLDLTDVDWTVNIDSVQLTASSDYFRVESGVFSGQDLDGTQGSNGTGYGAVWISPAIDIDGYADVSISLDVGASGDFENQDFIKASYSIDQGDTTQFGFEIDDNMLSLNSFSISGLSGSSLQIFVEMDNNAGGEVITFDNVLVEVTSTKAEPTDHVSSLSAVGSVGSIDLSWTDVASSPTPDGYLILANNTGFGTITDPSDGTAQSDDTDLSDGSATFNVVQGTESASFSGLDETTTYYFKIYPYTNSGSDINYKTDGTVPEAQATTLETPDIVLNEFLADPDAGNGDANGDGTVSSDDDEFIEFVNTGSTDLTITNWTIEDAGGTTHTFGDPTVLKPKQAVVIFGGGTPTGNFGSAIVQTTGSLSLNNSGDDIILKNASGVEIINYTYGSEGGDNQSVTRNPDLSGNFEKHETADTDDGSSFSPGTRIDGSTFQPSVTISGDAGWRMLSFPISGGTVSDISDDTAIQGISGGADPDHDDAVFLFYKSDTNGYAEPTNVNSTFGDGYGFITYFFDNTVNGSSELPITLDAFGNEPASDVTVDLNPDGAFTMAGNPFASNYDLSAITATGGTIQNTVQFWDAGTDSYVAQDRTTAFIASTWQGFWVESQDGAESITFPTSGKTTSSATATYFAKQDQSKADVEFTLSSDRTMDKAIRLSFREGATSSWDVDDATKITPFVSSGTPYATMAFIGIDDQDKLHSVFSLPYRLDETYEISLQENIVGIEAGEFTLSWKGIETLPNMELTFHDFKTGQSLNMQEVSAYTFEAAGVQAKKREQDSIMPSYPEVRPVKAKTDEAPRFAITVAEGTSVANEPSSTPGKFSLQQNYPNPFNPVTSIKYSIAKHGDVHLTIYNVMGQKVTTLVQENKSPGTYQVSWDASNRASGVYYYRLQVAGNVLTRKMTLIK